MGSDLPEVKVIIFVGRERLGRPSADPAIIPREAIIQLDIMCDTLKISSLCMRLYRERKVKVFSQCHGPQEIFDREILFNGEREGPWV